VHLAAFVDAGRLFALFLAINGMHLFRPVQGQAADRDRYPDLGREPVNWTICLAMPRSPGL
jgi:hypothetical protein